MTTLDYSHCSLEQVPKEIFTFEKTLEELYLDANQIEELPKVCWMILLMMSSYSFWAIVCHEAALLYCKFMHSS